MEKRLLALLVLLFAFSGLAGPNASAASPPVRPAPVCGPPAQSQRLVEPPDIAAWTLPIDAAGDRELILAVHHDAARFCYRYTWNGAVQTVPPVIRVRRGERFALRIVNDVTTASKGERVSSTAITPCMPMAMPVVPAVRYTGYLNHTIDDRYMPMSPIDSNIHLHGFRGPAAQEDVFLSTLSTPMHACEYRITIPRAQPPGTYFYHPHVHGASFLQVAGGLAGAWIVEPDTAELARSAEHVIVLRYRQPVVRDNPFAPQGGGFDAAAGQHAAAIRPAAPVPYDAFDPPPWPLSYPMKSGGVTLSANGCDGLASEALVSVNGSNAPATLDVPAGETQLLRIVNATTDSSKPLVLRDALGHVRQMQIVGRDGVPVSGDAAHPLARYIPMNRLLLEPSGRADVLITATAGQTLTLGSDHYCEGADAFYQLHHDLLRMAAVAGAGTSAPAIVSAPMAIADTPAEKLVAFARAHPTLVRRRAITFTEYTFPKTSKSPLHAAYYITDTTNPRFHEHPFWPTYAPGATVPENPDIVVKAGAVEEWYLINTTMEVHAFHIHQMSFVNETNQDGVPLTVDVALVPVGKLLPNPRDPNYPLVRPSITKVLLDFRHVPRGTFVFHCHMLFHEDRGMMGVIRVE